MSLRILPSRAAAIIIHQEQILLLHRKKHSSIYYVFPGGTVEAGESTEQAAAREVLEETSIHVAINALVYQMDIVSDYAIKHEFFYVAQYLSGTPQLQPDSIEAVRSSATNSYQPMWVPLAQVPELTLFPIEIKELLLSSLYHGFDRNVQHLTVQKNSLKNR